MLLLLQFRRKPGLTKSCNREKSHWGIDKIRARNRGKNNIIARLLFWFVKDDEQMDGLNWLSETKRKSVFSLLSWRQNHFYLRKKHQKSHRCADVISWGCARLLLNVDKAISKIEKCFYFCRLKKWDRYWEPSIWWENFSEISGKIKVFRLKLA